MNIPQRVEPRRMLSIQKSEILQRNHYISFVKTLQNKKKKQHYKQSPDQEIRPEGKKFQRSEHETAETDKK